MTCSTGDEAHLLNRPRRADSFYLTLLGDVHASWDKKQLDELEYLLFVGDLQSALPRSLHE